MEIKHSRVCIIQNCHQKADIKYLLLCKIKNYQEKNGNQKFKYVYNSELLPESRCQIFAFMGEVTKCRQENFEKRNVDKKVDISLLTH